MRTRLVAVLAGAAAWFCARPPRRVRRPIAALRRTSGSAARWQAATCSRARGPLDCESTRAAVANFSAHAVRVMQSLCEHAIGGAFLIRSELSEDLYCFPG